MGALLLMAVVTLRRLQAGDLERCLELTQAERWSHRLEDWAFHYGLGLGWAACDADGKLLGTASWWAYGPEFATVGLVLVDQQHQGRGIGRQLMNAVIAEAGPRSLQLVATKAGLTLYQRCGFRERHTIGQHHGVPTRIPPSTPPPDAEFRAASRANLGALFELDAVAFGANRQHVLRAVHEAGNGVLAYRHGRLVGYALSRQSGRGTLIGPLVADDESLAIALIAQQLERTRGFTRLDIPTDALQLAQWLETLGLACVDRVTVMVRGDPRHVHPEAGVFGLVSQALG
jgi:GNAT superfamily N-acetyltransferase